MKKHIERVWEDIVQLLEEEFPLPIEISLVIPRLQKKLMSIKLMTLVRHKQCMKYWVHCCGYISNVQA